MALTQARLKELLSYDPLTGDLTRLVKTAPCVKIGEVAGTVRADGYVQISVDGVHWLGHRLAFLYMTGEVPDEIDHDDRVRSNNQWDNLKACTHSENGVNTPVRAHSKTQVKNVSETNYGAFRVRLKRLGKIVYDRVFSTMAEAIAARDAVTKGV